MNPREKGFLLLTSHLGNPERRVLTAPQLRQLTRRMAGMDIPSEERELCLADLIRLGYGPDMAVRILELLNDEDILSNYLYKAQCGGCYPVTRISGSYPLILRKRLGEESPGCLWLKGECEILASPGIALVGSRDLLPENQAFAEAVGIRAAEQGLTLISGNARGADRAAQEACLAHGGRVISVIADSLESQPLRERVLYVSEDGYDLPFTSQRALSRNRVIHSWGELTFVAQAKLGSGGSWVGTTQNLRCGWSTVVCYRDGSEAMRVLEQQGAYLADIHELQDMTAFLNPQLDIFHRQ